MENILISVAPVNAAEPENDPCAIAQDVVNAYEAGAGMVHLHCRDAQGRLTPELAHLEKTVSLIRARCPIVIEVSTGGVSDLTIAERCAPCFPNWVECNSLNVGSVNLGEAVYANPIRDVHHCVEQILAQRKVPEIEVFEIGMINTVRELAEKYDFVKPIFFALVLGHQGAMPATVPALDLMLRGLRDSFPCEADTLWGITHAHRADWTLIEAALDRGARSVRIGFEDSNCLDAGVCAETNAAMVERLADILRLRGLSPASPAEIRAALGVPGIGAL